MPVDYISTGHASLKDGLVTLSLRFVPALGAFVYESLEFILAIMK